MKGGSRPPGAGPGGGGGFQRRTRSRVDEARDILANVVLCHVPVVAFDYQQKVRGSLGWVGWGGGLCTKLAHAGGAAEVARNEPAGVPTPPCCRASW